jgi:copper chaperone CopZ
MSGRSLSLLTLLIASAIVSGFTALNISSYVFAETPPAPKALDAATLQRVVIPVEGMSCATCEIGVRHALKGIDGVKSAHVSVATRTAAVDYEPAKTNPGRLVAAINSTGYRASLADKLNDSKSMAKNQNINDPNTEPDAATPGENTITRADQVSVFKVSLVCPAAPHLGCGSASKPILLDLEKQQGVREAWLNRAGTTIAVVWRSDADTEMRRNVTAELKEDQATEMQGESRDEAVKDFLSGKGWYRGADVDRLSEEEAGIIAARLVRRVQTKVPLTGAKAEGLQRALADAFKKLFISGKISDKAEPFRLKDVAGQYLDEEQIKILKEVIDRGVRPLPNES